MRPVATDEKMFDRLVPISGKVPTIAIVMMLAISAYSIAVAPLSSRRNAFR